MRQSALITAALLASFQLSCPGTGQTSCGDLFLDPDETCDDGNALPGDGCDEQCQLECGNGVIDENEECEDGNRDPDDGCDDLCHLECGNGVLDGGEECEPTLTPNDCSEDCRWLLPEADIEVPATGESITIPGEIRAASPEWTRPIGACTSYITTTGECPYEGYVMRNSNGNVVTVTIDALAGGSDNGTLVDDMLFLYEGGWPPHDALSCVASDDDGGDGRDARLEAVEIQPDRDYYLVVSSFRGVVTEDRFGTYELRITVQ